MVSIYPVVFTPIQEGYMAYVPDLDINTHGKNLAEAITMARDAISLWCVGQQDEVRPLPAASLLSAVVHNEDDILTLVDADIDASRRILENRAVKKH